MQGTLANPIVLDLDQPEPEQEIEQQLEQARRKQLLDEAKLSRNGIELAFAVIKTTIKGELKLKNKTLNRAIIRYFQNRIGINVSCDNFHPRREPVYENNPINPLEFLLYGVDFLTTAMIQDRFKLIDTTLQQIKWINSSCCKLIFKTESEAKMVLESQVVDKRTLQIKIDEQSGGNLLGWFILKPYHFLNFQRQLMMRYSTQNQNEIEKEEMNKYKDYETAYAELLPSLIEEFHAFTAYEQVMKEIEREKIEQIINRQQYHRNRRVRNFVNRQGSRQRMDRSRTRDKRYHNHNKQNRRNQNFYQRDINTSFQFRGRNSRVSNKHNFSNDINTSFQMMREGQTHREDNNVSNNSFQMQAYNENNNQNRQNFRSNQRWQRNNNRESDRVNQNEFQAKVVKQVVYEHRPVDWRQMRTHNNNNNQKLVQPARKKNVYYDCNGIDDEDNLSYEFRSCADDINNQDSDNLELINQSFNFKPKPKDNHSKTKENQKHNLSFLINSLNNSKEDYVHKKIDESFRINNQSNQQILNKSLNDCSFVMNSSNVQNKPQEYKQKVDFNQLFHLHDQDDISPIHIASNDTSFVMREPQPQSNKNEDSFLDFKKPTKNKKKQRYLDEDDGY